MKTGNFLAGVGPALAMVEKVDIMAPTRNGGCEPGTCCLHLWRPGVLGGTPDDKNGVMFPPGREDSGPVGLWGQR